MNLLILVVDDEPDVEALFKQHFRRDLRSGRFTMEFALSGPAALALIEQARDVELILILSDINMPGMSGLELLPKVRAARPLSTDQRHALSRPERECVEIALNFATGRKERIAQNISTRRTSDDLSLAGTRSRRGPPRFFPRYDSFISQCPVRRVLPPKIEDVRPEVGVAFMRGEQKLTITRIDRRFGTGQKSRAYPGSRRTESQHRSQAPAVSDTTRGDHRHLAHSVNNGWHESNRCNRSPHVPTGFPALRYDTIRSSSHRSPSFGCRPHGLQNQHARRFGSLDHRSRQAPEE